MASQCSKRLLRSSLNIQMLKEAPTVSGCVRNKSSTSKDGARYLEHQDKKESFGNTKLPANIREIEASQQMQFTPIRTRDMSSAHIGIKMNQSGGIFSKGFMSNKSSNGRSNQPYDNHIGKYDCNHTVSLSSAIDTNVPQPYKRSAAPSPFHMGQPTGYRSQTDKYVAADQQSHHYTRQGGKKSGIQTYGTLFPCLKILNLNANIRDTLGNQSACHFHTVYCLLRAKVLASQRRNGMHVSARLFDDTQQPPLSPKSKLRQVVVQYGSTVLVFHIALAIVSLGCWYLIVSSQVDLTKLMELAGIDPLQFSKQAEQAGAVASHTSENSPTQPVAILEGASSFVIAYAIHKATAPIRIGFTVATAPLLVRYLKRIGLLKSKPI